MCDTMGGEGGSRGGRKTAGGRKPLFAVLSRFYFRCEEIPTHGQKMERGAKQRGWRRLSGRLHMSGFIRQLVFYVRPRKCRTRCGLFALSGALTAPNCRFKHPCSKIHAKGHKIEI